MKYNKMISLLALGTLFGPTLLSSQQVFADESSTVASTTPAPQPTENSSTEGTDTSETLTPEPVKQHNLLADGTPIANNTFSMVMETVSPFNTPLTRG